MNEIKYDSIKVPIEVVDCAKNTVTKKKRNKNKKYIFSLLQLAMV